jgi:hypothetical protein
MEKRGGQTPTVRPEFTQVGDDMIIGSTEWSTPDGGPQERYQVITFREGKIRDMQGFRARREAERFASRRS